MVPADWGSCPARAQEARWARERRIQGRTARKRWIPIRAGRPRTTVGPSTLRDLIGGAAAAHGGPEPLVHGLELTRGQRLAGGQADDRGGRGRGDRVVPLELTAAPGAQRP